MSDSVTDGLVAQVDRAASQHSTTPVYSLRHLAHLTGTPFGELRGLAHYRTLGYRSFSIAKRGGGRRPIDSPTPTLRHVQRWLNDHVLGHQPVHRAAIAYVPGQSVKKGAARHCRARWLIKFDLHDFFGSVSERQVYDVVAGLGLLPLASYEITRLTTLPQAASQAGRGRFKPVDRSRYTVYRKDPRVGALPQGAPTSPALSNLAMRGFDHRLQALADDAELVYTRYADDICFSSLDSNFGRAAAERLIDQVHEVIISSGFVPHRRKTRVVPPGARKIVLGLLVDGPSPRLPVHFRRRVDCHIRGIRNWGLTHHAAHRGFHSMVGMVRHIAGLLTYAQDIQPAWAAPRENEFEHLLALNGWT